MQNLPKNGIKNIAAIVFDVEKNEVVAYCGNVDFEKDISANQVDIIQALAVQAVYSSLFSIVLCCKRENYSPINSYPTYRSI
jgi:hypothetical protein